MFRTYLAAAMLAFGAYSYGQYRGWSILPSEAQEFQRQRAEQRAAAYGGSGTRSGRSGSGHK